MKGIQIIHIFLCMSKSSWTSTYYLYVVFAFSQIYSALTAIALFSLIWAWNSYYFMCYSTKEVGTTFPKTSPLRIIIRMRMIILNAVSFLLVGQPRAKLYYLSKHRGRAWKNDKYNKQSLRSQTWGIPWEMVGPQRYYIFFEEILGYKMLEKMR